MKTTIILAALMLCVCGCYEKHRERITVELKDGARIEAAFAGRLWY